MIKNVDKNKVTIFFFICSASCGISFPKTAECINGKFLIFNRMAGRGKYCALPKGLLHAGGRTQFAPTNVDVTVDFNRGQTQGLPLRDLYILHIRAFGVSRL
jgi:hypothetical protein